MYFCQGNDVLSLERLSSSDAVLVLMLESNLAEVLDEGYEDVFGIVFFKGEVWSG